jgi:protein gp37
MVTWQMAAPTRSGPSEMKNTPIGWCDHTFNPWIGCTKVSTECKFCYAEALELRWGKDLWGPGKERQHTSAANWRQPLAWDKEAVREGVRRRVFSASLADIFDEAVPDDWRYELFGLIANCPNLDWLILTKRPQKALEFFEDKDYLHAACCEGQAQKLYEHLTGDQTSSMWFAVHFPLPNVWLGVSVGNQEAANERIPILMQIPAAVRFLSCEPLLEPVFLWQAGREVYSKIDWVITGGESGPRCRPMHPSWATTIRYECKDNGMAFFMKQLGGHPNKREDLADLPEDLRVREWPA